jgi:hypothetical protein
MGSSQGHSCRARGSPCDVKRCKKQTLIFVEIFRYISCNAKNSMLLHEITREKKKKCATKLHTITVLDEVRAGATADRNCQTEREEERTAISQCETRGGGIRH